MNRTSPAPDNPRVAATINVLSGAPFGYRYVPKTEHADAVYEIVPHEAAIVAELFARYADGGVAIAELTRWMSILEVATRTGKTRWDRSVVWGMLRNPAYAGRACFGKTMRSEQTAGLNRTARLAGRSTPRHYTVTDRARGDWLEIPVPALVDEDTWARVQRRLEDNKRYASRNSKNPSLLQGICACSGGGVIRSVARREQQRIRRDRLPKSAAVDQTGADASEVQNQNVSRCLAAGPCAAAPSRASHGLVGSVGQRTSASSDQ